MSGLVFEDFQPHAGAVFILHEQDLPPLELTLETVESLKGIGLPGVRPSFSLTFRCAEQQALEGRIYCLEHPAMGEVEIYLSPVARDANGVQYQALFN
jgi:hypothetical protein